MKREILFRGKEKRDGNFIYGYYTGLDYIYSPESKDVCWYEVIPETIGQFTGLTDKNGVKIFEGDKISWTKSDYKYLVVYENGAFYCYHTDLKNWDGNSLKWGLISRFAELGMELEVIGNIHDNKDLLK